MPTQIAPDVIVSEYDFTQIIPAVSTSVAAISGPFLWGPVGFPILISDEPDLQTWFDAPTDFNAETWFCAANFLADGSALWVNRTIDGAQNAIAHGGNVANVSVFLILNSDDYENKLANGDFIADSSAKFVAKYPGSKGNKLIVSVCPSVNAYQSTLEHLTDCVCAVRSKSMTLVFNNIASANAAWQTMEEGDKLVIQTHKLGRQIFQIKDPGTQPSIANVTITLVDKYQGKEDLGGQAALKAKRYWQFQDYFSGAPGTSDYVNQFGNTTAKDCMHVFIGTATSDLHGAVTGAPIQMLEIYEQVSRATDCKKMGGTGPYYGTYISNNSKWTWWTNDITGAASANAQNIASSSNGPFTQAFEYGDDGDGDGAMDLTDRMTGYDPFLDKEKFDISIFITGPSSGGLAGEGLTNYLSQNIAEVRKDCVVCSTPPRSMVVNNVGLEAQTIVGDLIDGDGWTTNLAASNRLILDPAYGWTYDRYNDKYRWIPLNGGTAGLLARTDLLRGAFWSPAGFNRGQYKNVAKLSWNPTDAERDLLFQNFVNPVKQFRGDGIILMGDRTFAGVSSDFDFINIRRLFILLEKAISLAAKFMLFEFNDEFTRAQFVNMVSPYLRLIQGLRGITNFEVQCDENNNPPEVVQAGKFNGTIFIEAAHPIRRLGLNFVAVGGNVDFNVIDSSQFGGL